MGTLARMSFRVRPERLSDFETEYDARVAPLLKERGLDGGRDPDRPAVDGVSSRVFQVEDPSAVLHIRRRLRRDANWRETLERLGAEFGQDGGTVPWQLEIYRTAAGPGKATLAGPGYRRGQWLNLGVQDGVPGGPILAVLQGGEGHLWIGTAHGLSRYDGSEFVHYGPPDGLAGEEISSLVEDRAGRLWIGTDKGLSRYDGSEFVHYGPADGLAGDQVYCLVEDREGRLWIGTDKGLSRYDGSRFIHYPQAGGLVGERIVCMVADHRGWIWFGGEWHGKGLGRYDGTGFSLLCTRDGLPADAVSAIIEDREGNLWIGTNRGPCRYDGKEFYTLTREEHGLSYDVISALLEDGQGNLWLGAMAGGVNRFDGNRCTVFTTHDGLANNHVQCICEDREGYLWFGTIAGGLARYDGVQIEHFSRTNGLSGSFVFDILEDRKGRLWFGLLDGADRLLNGADRYGAVRFEHFDPGVGLSRKSGYVCCMLEDRDGHLWFRSMDGLTRYDGERFTPFVDPEKLHGVPLLRMAQDREGHIWLGTGSAGEGVLRFDGQDFVRFTMKDGLPDDFVYEILADRHGILWFGTKRGLSRYDGHVFQTFTTEDGLAGDKISALLEDREEGLWIGTHRGLTRYAAGVFTSFPAGSGNVPWDILKLVQGEDGTLWIGSFGQGVFRYDGRVFQRFDRRDGLINDSVQCVLEDRHGDIWIGTEGGATRYRPLHTAPRIRLREVMADQRYPGTGRVVLPATQKWVRFSFQGSSLSTPPDRMAYVYRLRGYDREWRVAYEGQATYSGLEEGEYTFEVKAVDRDLNYSPAARVQVAVEPDPHVQALREALSGGSAAGEFVGRSAALRKVQEELARVARTAVTVLILGETGTGKGLAARTLHALSDRGEGPFVQVSCGTIPEGLIESELFGHEKGAFTGAVRRKLGKVELARGGTLFLDEIGDMEVGLQTKLLRLLEEGTFERVGGTETLSAQVRVVAATNRDLAGMVSEGRFREDLYYRLNVFTVRLPPLREREEDIALLAYYFLERMAEHLHKQVDRITPGALSALQEYGWPGNVRELEHVMQRGVIVCRGRTVGAEDLGLGEAPVTGGGPVLTLEEVERRHIAEVLEQTGWVIKGPNGAAGKLGLPVSTLRSRMKKLGIVRAQTTREGA